MLLKPAVRGTTPPVTPTRLQSDLRAVLDRSVSISNARGVDVQTDGQVVVLRGAGRAFAAGTDIRQFREFTDASTPQPR